LNERSFNRLRITSRVSSPSDPQNETFAESDGRANIHGALEQAVDNINKKISQCNI